MERGSALRWVGLMIWGSGCATDDDLMVVCEEVTTPIASQDTGTLGISGDDVTAAVGYVVLFAARGIWIFLWQFAKTKTGRYKIDQLKLKLPVFGQLFLKSSIAKFARTLATLIRSGINILYALEIVAKTVGNAVIEQAVLKTRISIQSGESITRPLVESGIFPPMVTRMVDVGERTGALESMLTKIADFYDDEVETAVNAMTSMLEPMLMVFLGGVVGGMIVGNLEL